VKEEFFQCCLQLFIIDEGYGSFDLLIGPYRVVSAFVRTNAAFIVDHPEGSGLSVPKPQALVSGNMCPFVLIELSDESGIFRIALFPFLHLIRCRHDRTPSVSSMPLTILDPFSTFRKRFENIVIVARVHCWPIVEFDCMISRLTDAGKHL
jgi:hypothetical protein